jgi:flagellin-like protein
MKKIFRNKKGVSEIVGTILLLGMAIALFVIVHIVALDVIPYTPNAPSVRISGELQGGDIYLQHNGGDSLPLNTKIIFTDIDGDTILNDIVSNNNGISNDDGDSLWNIGETLRFNDLGTNIVNMILIDVETNAIIAQDTFQEVN